MIREYCDKCGSEIKLPHRVINEDKEELDSEERFEVSVKVKVGDDNDDVSTDVLCPKCIQGFVPHPEAGLQ
jgi:hypothetical protein